MKKQKSLLSLTLLLLFMSLNVIVKAQDTTKLFEAVKKNQINKIVKYADDGGNINIKNDKGNTPLHYASSIGNKSLVHQLINMGANVNEVNADNNTPLTIAIIRERNEVVDILLKAGADPNFENSDHMNSTHIAALMGNYDVMISLIANKADINIMSETGVTPLMLAAAKGYYDVVHLLLRNDAKDLANKDGENALKWAQQNGHKSVIEILEANPGRTALNLTHTKGQ